MLIRVHKRNDPAYDCYAKTDRSNQIPYYLEEENNWSFNIGEMKKAIDEARPHCEPRGLVLVTFVTMVTSDVVGDEPDVNEWSGIWFFMLVNAWL